MNMYMNPQGYSNSNDLLTMPLSQIYNKIPVQNIYGGIEQEVGSSKKNNESLEIGGQDYEMIPFDEIYESDLYEPVEIPEDQGEEMTESTQLEERQPLYSNIDKYGSTEGGIYKYYMKPVNNIYDYVPLGKLPNLYKTIPTGPNQYTNFIENVAYYKNEIKGEPNSSDLLNYNKIPGTTPYNPALYEIYKPLTGTLSNGFPEFYGIQSELLPPRGLYYPLIGLYPYFHIFYRDIDYGGGVYNYMPMLPLAYVYNNLPIASINNKSKINNTKKYSAKGLNKNLNNYVAKGAFQPTASSPYGVYPLIGHNNVQGMIVNQGPDSNQGTSYYGNAFLSGSGAQRVEDFKQGNNLYFHGIEDMSQRTFPFYNTMHGYIGYYDITPYNYYGVYNYYPHNYIKNYPYNYDPIDPLPHTHNATGINYIPGMSLWQQYSYIPVEHIHPGMVPLDNTLVKPSDISKFEVPGAFQPTPSSPYGVFPLVGYHFGATEPSIYGGQVVSGGEFQPYRGSYHGF